jgi:hypothetical protein
MKTDIVNKLRMYAEDLHSAGGFNGYASAMSLAADEIERLRQAVLNEREAVARVADEWPLEGYGLAAIIRARGEK